ncbi:MAG: O-methyltransferase [Bacteroidota bacterium]
MEFFPPELSAYVEHHSSPESDLLRRIHRETHLHVLKPRMVSGHLQGRFLSMISHMMRPRRILEIGTFTGYSALCLAEGLQPDGRLVTIDINEELTSRVRSYFDDSPYGHQIEMKIGNALDILPNLEETWDLAFIDADKVNYHRYYDLLIDKMRPGGVLLADNVLWSGKVTQNNKTDEDTVAIRDFNQKIQEDPKVENVLAPIRDGLMMIRKC